MNREYYIFYYVPHFFTQNRVLLDVTQFHTFSKDYYYLVQKLLPLHLLSKTPIGQ